MQKIKKMLNLAIIIAIAFNGLILFGCKDIKCNHDFILNSLITNNVKTNKCGKFVCSKCGEKRNQTITHNDVNVPILTLNGSMDGISKENKITVSVEYESESCSFVSDATLKLQGSSSVRYPKKNYNITFLEAGTTKKKKVQINEDWGKQSKYTLKANYIDFSQARNIVSGQLYSEIVHSRNLEDIVGNLNNGGVVDGFPILIYHNGNYLGLYTINIPKDDWMFGMTEDEIDDSTITKHAALSTGDWTDEVSILKEVENYSTSGFELEYCSTEDTIGTDWVLESFNNMIRFILNSSDEEFKNNISTYVNLERAMDSMLFTQVILGKDNLSKNIIWLTYDGVQWFPSMYDMDATWGMEWDGSRYFNANLDILTYNSCNYLYRRILNLYEEEVSQRYAELRDSILSIDNITKVFTDFNNGISPIIRNAELEKWVDIPSKNTSNLEQILSFANERLTYLDEKY